MKTQKHPITPRCLLKHKDKEFVNRPENLVDLTHREHLKAHQWLAMLTNDQLCWFAYLGMKSGKWCLSGADNPMYGIPMTDERRKNISNGNKRAYKEGKNRLTEDGLRRKSKYMKGNQHAKGMTYTHSDDAKKAISEFNKGKKMSKKSVVKLKKNRKGKGTGERNSMSNLENRKKVGLSKIGRKKLTHENLPNRMSLPNSNQWNELLSIGYKPGTVGGV